MRTSAPHFIVLIVAAGMVLLAGCDALFGSKFDPTTDQIFDDGSSDPGSFEEVGYVPLFPFFEIAGDGGSFDEPNDVFIGYDQFIYVTDRRGLHVLDRAGRPLTHIGEVGGQPLRSSGCVMQDRNLDLYVCARRDSTISDTSIVFGDTTVTTNTWDLAVVYRLGDITTGGPARVRDIIWHVFSDRSREFNVTYRNPRVFDSGISDEEAEFTGVGVLHDNSLYISRRGPLNRPGAPPSGDGRPATVFPFNSLLIYNNQGVNTGRVNMRPDDHSIPTLRSTVYPSDVITYFAPPQSTGLPPRLDFFVSQAPPLSAPVPQPTFAVLAINVVQTPEGTEYRQDTQRIGVAGDTTRGDGFLYEPNKFERPTDMARAADGTGYLFVVDGGKDSLFVFNDAGIEGVTPPPGAGDRTRPFVVSFGGTGSGPLEFRNPNGVAYLNRVVYVADTDNNRISRFKLNTDFE